MTTQNTALAPQNGQTRALAAPMPPVGLEGMDDFSTEDLLIPVLKIVQGTSRMPGADEHIGQFWNSISEEFAKTVNVVILNGRHSRSLFSSAAGESDRPECVSRDAVTGSAYGACSACDFNPDVHPNLWDDQGLKRCNKGFTLFLYLLDSDEFALFTASKTNVTPIRKLNTQLSLKLKVPLFGALVELATEKHEEKGKKWYQLAPHVARKLESNEIAEYREMATALRGVQIKVVEGEEDAATAPSEHVDPDAPPISAYESDAPSAAGNSRLPF